MEILQKFFSFIWNIIEIIKDTIENIIEFIKELINFIPSFLEFLPSEIASIFLPLIVILVGIFIYRFVR